MKNLFKISFLTAITPFLLNNSASAQLIPDQSLGNESSVVNSTNNLLQVDGGATRGNNLFHSFREFNVNTNQEVFFNNGINIESIFTRVTGGNISNIDGLISNVGQADLFILNPAGIVFGENAQLNIGGSFFATTAESILFADNTEFSTNDVNNKSLLTVTAPIGLRLNNPGKIINQANLIKEERFGDEQLPTIFPVFRKDIPLEEKIVNTLVGLEVNPNQNITLVGGDIELNGGGLTALSGKIQVGGLANEGIIQINANGNLVFPNNSLLSNISLINDASIDVQGKGGGDIIITGQTVIVKNGSSLFAGIRPFKGSINSQAGDIIINGTDSVIFDGVRSRNSQRGGSNFPTNATNQIGLAFEKELKTESKGFDFIVNGKGQGGNIEINTKKLDITNGAKIVSLNYGEGNTGNIIINTEENISINSPGSSIFNTIFIGQGNAGNIEINTESLKLTQNATISENIFKGNGNLGNIIINAEERLFIDSNSSIFNTINKNGIGNGGIIKLKSKNLFLTNKGQLFTSTAG
nr:filamentous hemagglutinin N-terminal domain-containing protein [Xenococcaceae cyanobacterium MO_188.B19]